MPCGPARGPTYLKGAARPVSTAGLLLLAFPGYGPPPRRSRCGSAQGVAAWSKQP